MLKDKMLLTNLLDSWHHTCCLLDWKPSQWLDPPPAGLNPLFYHRELGFHGRPPHCYPRGSFGTTDIYWVPSVPNWQMLAPTVTLISAPFWFPPAPEGQIPVFGCQRFCRCVHRIVATSVSLMFDAVKGCAGKKKKGFLIPHRSDKTKTLMCSQVHRGKTKWTFSHISNPQTKSFN